MIVIGAPYELGEIMAGNMKPGITIYGDDGEWVRVTATGVELSSCTPTQAALLFWNLVQQHINIARDQEVWTPKDILARDRLRCYFMDYPSDEGDVKMNEEIARTPLNKLVDLLLKQVNELKQKEGFRIECLNIPPHD